jgi:hypothetical protein
MAFDTANLACYGHANGFGLYRYDTTDDLDVVEDAGYIHISDDNQNMAKGDIVHAFSWTTAVRTGILAAYKMFVVTNVIANGNVNLAEVGVSTAGAISSGD